MKTELLSRWIPVEEKLPEKMQDCLVTVQRFVRSNSGKTERLDKWVQIASRRSDGIWIDDDGTIGCEARDSSEKREVTHWMAKPLPAAPDSRPSTEEK